MGLTILCRIFPTFVEYCQSHITLLWMWIMLWTWHVIFSTILVQIHSVDILLIELGSIKLYYNTHIVVPTWSKDSKFDIQRLQVNLRYEGLIRFEGEDESANYYCRVRCLLFRWNKPLYWDQRSQTSLASLKWNESTTWDTFLLSPLGGC